MKFCSKCADVRPLTDFPKNRSTRSGYGSYCKPCHNETTRKNIQKNYGTTRHYHLMRRYGIGAAEVEQLLGAQGWICPICTTSLTLKTAHVDHDHATGLARGIVCFSCNGGLGQFRDNPQVLRRAASYVECSRPITTRDDDYFQALRAVVDGKPVSVLERRLRARLTQTDLGTAS
jgi:hypothetical protein